MVPAAVDLEFTDEGNLVITECGLFHGEHDTMVVSNLGEETIDFHDLRFRLTWEGKTLGRSFRLRTVPLENVGDEIIARTLATESERNSGVIVVTYGDADPRRAAQVVNALCDNYRDRQRRSGTKRCDTCNRIHRRTT